MRSKNVVTREDLVKYTELAKSVAYEVFPLGSDPAETVTTPLRAAALKALLEFAMENDVDS